MDTRKTERPIKSEPITPPFFLDISNAHAKGKKKKKKMMMQTSIIHTINNAFDPQLFSIIKWKVVQQRIYCCCLWWRFNVEQNPPRYHSPFPLSSFNIWRINILIIFIYMNFNVIFICCNIYFIFKIINFWSWEGTSVFILKPKLLCCSDVNYNYNCKWYIRIIKMIYYKNIIKLINKIHFGLS